MVNIIYNSFLRELLESDIDFETETFKVMLITEQYTPINTDSMKNISVWEINSPGYAKGGKTIALTIDENGTKIKSVAPVKWEGLSARVRYAVVYQVGEEDIPILCQDLLGVRNLSNSRLVLDWEDYLLELSQSADGPLTNYSGILGSTRLGTTILGGLGIEETLNENRD